MADEQVTVDAPSFEEALNNVLDMESRLLPDQRERLSKVLFPETHSKTVSIDGTVYELRPLTIKAARKLCAVVEPFSKQAEKAATSPESADTLNLNVGGVETLMSACKVLTDFYGWPDLAAKIAAEEITVSDLQSLVVNQQALQGDNDFLLGPLRMLIKMMQVQEILQASIATRAKSSSGTPLSSIDGTVPLTS